MALAGYGRLYVTGGAAAQALNASGGTFDKMTGFATAGISSYGTVSAATDEITLTAAGGDQMPVHIAFSVSFTVGTAGLYRIAVYKDGVVVAGSERRITAALTTTYTVSGHTLSTATDGTAPVFTLRVASDQVSPNFTPIEASFEVWM